jgi:2-keto-4-pentenoate hydratase/2-oxohepta-3-ene-1,7-dioic acid hydratase in catechol pathway
MRLGTVAGRAVLVRDGRALDVAAASDGDLPADMVALLGRWDDLASWVDSAADWATSSDITDLALGPPVPEPRQVFAVALNYAHHAAEAGYQPPEQPLVFTKFPSCIVGPVAEVALPNGSVDWEIEVVAVIGRGGFRIDRDDAWHAIAGVTIGQDLSERQLQLAGRPPQFSLGKSYPGFGPTGPVIVTPEELPDRNDLVFESWLDGEVIQSGRTSQMIFPIDDLVHRLSQVCPLLPGDLIFTGTPEGVGNRRTPPRFLRPGETLVSTLVGVGEIRQTFIAATVSSITGGQA